MFLRICSAIPVVLLAVLCNVPLAAQFNASPSSLSFPNASNPADPHLAFLTLTSMNSSSVGYTISTNTNGTGNWLTAVSLFGNTTPSTIQVRVDRGQINGGSASGFVIITPASGSLATIAIPVSATNYTDVSPAGLSFNSAQATSTQQVVVSTGAPTTLSASVNYASGLGWLSVNVLSPPGSQFVVNVTASIVGLAAGTFSATIVFTPLVGLPVAVPVSLTVPQPASVTATPAAVSLRYYIGGQFAQQTITMNNLLPGTTYTVTTSSTGGWLRTNVAGATSSSQFFIFTSAVNLAAGTYAGSVTISVAGQSPQVIPVELIVSPFVTLTASPAGLSFNDFGGSIPSAAQTVTITTSFPAQFTISDLAPWLGVSPLSGTTLGDSGQAATASISVSIIKPEALSPFRSYTEWVTVLALNASVRIPVTLLITGSAPGQALRYTSIAPCRIMETRPAYNFEGRTGNFGPPMLGGNANRTLDMTASSVCPLPADAKAYSLNITAIPKRPNTIVYVGDSNGIFGRTVTSSDGQIVANSAIVKAGAANDITVSSSGDADVLVDVTGYFSERTTGSVFYPITPCRAVDTRAAYRPTASAFGPPSLQAQATRRFALRSSPDCPGLANAAATAYAATITAVPSGPLQYITLWPSGSVQPNVSSINSPAARVVANSIILPAGADGSVDVSAYNTTDLIMDITGYFAPEQGQTGLFYFAVDSCFPSVRLTLDSAAVTAPFFDQVGCRIPSTARAVALNVTSDSNRLPMPFLTIYPTGQPRPNTSMLNAFEGQTVTNAAIIPLGSNGMLDFYAYGRTDLTVGVSGYFGR